MAWVWSLPICLNKGRWGPFGSAWWPEIYTLDKTHTLNHHNFPSVLEHWYSLHHEPWHSGTFERLLKTPLINSQSFLHLHKANRTDDIDGSCNVMPHSLTHDLLFQNPRREMMGYKDNSAYLQRPSCWGSKTGWWRGVCVPLATWLEQNAFLKPDVAEKVAAGCLLERSPLAL